MHGCDWDLLPDVFAPTDSPSTEIAMELLDLSDNGAFPLDGAMLEMGCGTGVIGVTAAMHTGRRVVAADINPAAVRNAELNAARHGVGDLVHAVRGDLFDGLAPCERFDVIFWSSPYVLAPADYEYQHIHERAYVDPGYVTHQRFLAEAPRWLAPGGTILLHFSTRGDLVALLRAAQAAGRGLHILRSLVHQEGEHAVDHMLVEVTTPTGVWAGRSRVEVG
ncbi:MAG TPA: methyltransferase [Pseudonocardiaceae bacterium]|nr:methyltransferase [Pseudonocardiaceae bacterium]